MHRIARRVLHLSAGACSLFILVGALACADNETVARMPTGAGPYVVVLGTAQDGGYPQAGTKPGPAWKAGNRRFAASVAIVDPERNQRWLVEATPDFREQLHALDSIAPVDGTPGLDGVLVTHAHIGHYTGLMHLGHEVMGARAVPVFAMPRMRQFLSTNGPWDQLVRFANIELRELEDGVTTALNERISITPFRVPHRDEYSETIGLRITGPSQTIVFLTDIDKWEPLDSLGVRIESIVESADLALLDGTFYANGEIPGRDMAQIPHPFIAETMQRFANADAGVRARIKFIHLNRTNPAAFDTSSARRAIKDAGFGVAQRFERFGL